MACDIVFTIILMLVFYLKNLPNATGVCQKGSVVKSREYSNLIYNYSIVGPVLSTINTENVRECEMACHLAIPDVCGMFNYFPSKKICELLYKDRPAQYRAENKSGSIIFKTRKCLQNPCLAGGDCYSIGHENNSSCLDDTKIITHIMPNGLKVNTAPVCFGAKDDSFGGFFTPVEGKVKTFRLVHTSGGLLESKKHVTKRNWGSLDRKDHLRIVVTDENNSLICPPPEYPKNAYMLYTIAGFRDSSPEIVLPEANPPVAVTKGQEFRVWFGEDLADLGEGSGNQGITCADVYVYYTE